VVAGTHSGVGKTTVATGLMAALRARGVAVAPAKVGPDFIDPGYHQVATGRPGRNLDPVLSGDEALLPLAARAGAGADVLVVEGVMGLFDGVGSGGRGSTAEVAARLEAPVVLVVDASGMSGSVAALVHGYDDTLRRRHGRGLAGVVLNRVGSPSHTALLTEALAAGPPVLGALGRDPALTWRDRHLGLVPVVEHPGAVARAVDRLGAAVADGVDLAAVQALARSAPGLGAGPLRPARPVPGGPVPVAVLGGPAFSFAYPDNLERLVEAGAELHTVDPRHDEALPAGVRALYAGGGYPEVYVAELSANQALRADVAARVGAGLTTWAECGGLLWLSRALDGRPQCAVVPATASMTARITVGYATATVQVPNPVAPVGAVLVGHELHYAAVEPAGRALHLEGRGGPRDGGWAAPHLLASFLHLHCGADPTPVESFLGTAVSGWAKPSR
jgi:cobyrinic acid a,c-diamide synthase